MQTQTEELLIPTNEKYLSLFAILLLQENNDVTSILFHLPDKLDVEISR